MREMNAKTLRSISALFGFLLLTGAVLAAQPKPHDSQKVQAATDNISFSDKPHAPIDIDYEFQSTPEVGQPLVIELQFRSRGRIHDTNYRSGSELMISHREDARLVSDAGDENTVSQTITTIPEANGLYHLSVFASVWENGQLLHRVVSIPVQVGPKSDDIVVAEKLNGVSDSDGVPLKKLPVRTTITQK
jgi:hypothetical protein